MNGNWWASFILIAGFCYRTKKSRVEESCDMGKLILVVEDDEDNRDLMGFLIHRSHLDVELMMVENGKEAIQCIRK
jgi:hypothetical protein